MSAASLLPPRLLERLGGLDVIARTVVEGAVAGAHRSPYRGSGEEFARHRAYQQGDDARRIDWRLFARTDRLHVREYREDSNLSAYLVVDASPSMGYADDDGVSKLRYATYLAAALAFLMLRAGDAVGLAAFGDGTRLLAPPSGRGGQLAAVLHALDGLEPQGPGADGAGASPAAEALDRIGGVLGRKGRVVLISDLLEDGDGAALVAALGRLRARGDEVVVLRPLTPAETGERAPGPGLFYDPERPAAARPAAPADDPGYAERVGAYYARLERALGEQGVEYVPALTTTPVEQTLGEWLRRRSG